MGNTFELKTPQLSLSSSSSASPPTPSPKTPLSKTRLPDCTIDTNSTATISNSKAMSATVWANFRSNKGEVPATPPLPTPDKATEPKPLNNTDKDRTTFKAKRASMNGVGSNLVSEDSWDCFQTKREPLTEGKDKRILELEGEVNTLKEDGAKKDSYIEKLVTEVDERDRRIQQLEAKLDEKVCRLQKLENEVTDLELQDEVKDTCEQISKSEESVEPPTAELEAGSDVEPEAKGGAGIEDEYEAELVWDAEIETASQVEALSSESDFEEVAPEPEVASHPTAPLLVEDDFPELPRPAVAANHNFKPAPKLSFPIQNGGKVSKGAWRTEAKATAKLTGTWSTGKTLKDIRDMTKTERGDLFRGPTVTVFIGPEQIRGVPKYMFMAVSRKVREYFEENSQETYIHFPVRTIAVPVMKIIKEWLIAMGTSLAVFSLKLRKNLVQDLAIRRDCTFLGMEKYVAHFTRQYCDKIREGVPSFADISIYEKNTTDDDAVWECLTNNLSIMRTKKKIPDLVKFEEFLEQHPRLKQAMIKIDAHIAAKRSSPSSTNGDHSQSNTPRGKKNGGKGKKKKEENVVQRTSMQVGCSQSLRLVTGEEAAKMVRR